MIKIGFWRRSKNEDSELPWPTDYYNPVWDDEERLAVADYLDGGKVESSYKGWSDCRVCGCMNGSSDLTDGTYLWPEGLGHYVREHNISLPREFINHALKNADAAGVAQRAREKWAQEKEHHLEEMACRIREADPYERVDITTVAAGTPIPPLEVPKIPAPPLEVPKVPVETKLDVASRLLKAKAKGIRALENEKIKALESKVAYLDRVFNKKIHGLVPDWESLTFDQKADKIRDLMRKRRQYRRYS